MTLTYIVKQGDYLAKIAKDHGFVDWKPIWDHASNKALRDKRKNPNVLFPGDRIIVPEKGQKQLLLSVDEEHKFSVTRSKLKLVLALEDQYRKPLVNSKCKLVIDGETFNKTTDGKGKIEHAISPAAESGQLIVADPETPLNEIVIALKIGHLDPAEEESGQRERLNNLGYFAGPFDERTEEENAVLFKSAVEEFQCDRGLTVDGVCGPQTQAKLKEVHGS